MGMTDADPDRHLDEGDSLVIGKGTKMCEKCCKLHDGLTCRQFALMQDLQGNALVAVGVLAEFIETVVLRLKAGRNVEPGSDVEKEAQGLLDQIMRGPMFKERHKEHMYANQLAQQIWDDVLNLATFVVPPAFKAPFVAAAAYRLLRNAVIVPETLPPQFKNEAVRYEQSIKKSDDGKETTVTFAGVVGRRLWSISNTNVGWYLCDPEGQIILEGQSFETVSILVSQLNGSLLNADNNDMKLNAAMQSTQAPLRPDGDRVQALVDELERLRQAFIDESAKHCQTGVEYRRACDERKKLIDDGGVMALLDEAVDHAVDHGIHHSGKDWSQVSVEKILQGLAAEVVELSAELHTGNSISTRDELADCYIGIRHLVKKLKVTKHQLAAAGIVKLMSRNSYPQASADTMKRLKRLIDTSNTRVSEKGLRGG